MIVLVLLLVCSNLNSITRAEDNNDYINGLPSKERYDFIVKIARRLRKEVEVKDTPKQTKIEIPDAQLNQSSKIVNKVILEEREKLKTARKSNVQTTEQKKVNLTFRTGLHYDMKDHIDLTVVRKRRTIDVKDVENPKDTKIIRKREIQVPVKVVFDDARGTKQNEKRSRDHGDDNDYRRDGDVQLAEKKSEENKSIKEPNVVEGNSDTDSTTKSPSETTTSTAVEPDVTTDEDSSTKITVTEDVLTTTDESETETVPPQVVDTTFEVEFSNDTYATTENMVDTTTDYPVTESTVEPETTVPPTEELTNFVYTTQETATTESSTLENESKSTMASTHEPIYRTTMDFTGESESKSPMSHEPMYRTKVDLTGESETESAVPTTLEPTITFPPSLESKTTVPTGEPKKRAVEKSLRIGVVSEGVDRNDLYRADKLLRAGVEPTTGATDASFHYETLFKAVTKSTKKVSFAEIPQEEEVPSKTHVHGVKYYRVYEVDPAQNPLKLRTGSFNNRDQPHYAPVYNYEPESAFFNPQTRHGSNFEKGGTQTGTKELRTNVEQQSYAPIYNYEPKNAFYNPQNRLGPNADNLEEELYYKRAGIKVVKKNDNKDKDKINEDYYYARNGDIDGSLESRKFHFRSFGANVGKSPLKAAQSLQDNLLLKKVMLQATTQNPINIVHLQNQDYMDYHYGRKNGKKRDRSRNLKGKPDKFSLDKYLDAYFSNKKNAALARSRHLPGQSRVDDFLRENKKQGYNKPISLDYYYGAKNDEVNQIVEALQFNLHKLKYEKNSLTTEKPTGNGFRYRGVENNAIDLDYYFDRQESPTGFDSNFLRSTKYFVDNVDKNTQERSSEIPRNSARGEVHVENVKEPNNKVLEPYVSVLKYFFEINSEVLVKYDWLGTTVNIRAALAKLIYLIDAEEAGQFINPLDKEILKYLATVHEDATKSTSKRSNRDCFNLKLPEFVVNGLRKNILPKNKRTKRGEHIKNPLKLIRDVYHHLMRSCSDVEEQDSNRSNVRYQEFRKFLENLQDGLYDFHTAVKNIATVMKFDHQNWYQNIKDLYLTRPEPKAKELLEVLTHLVVMEIFEKIEQSAKDGLEDDATEYALNHKEEYDETKKELVFVLRVLEIINKDN